MYDPEMRKDCPMRGNLGNCSPVGGFCMDAVSNEICEAVHNAYNHGLYDAVRMLKEQEAKTGTWQWKIHGKAESGGTLGEAVCDQCGKSTYATAVKGDLNYCPNCGAKMTGRSVKSK